ncbi:MAG: nucleotidyl transferase AbiEii/AbiGii toxin family protein [Aliidongia sp.]
MDLSVANVTTVVAERTFWDKAVILHGLRQWFEKRGVLRGGGQRVSRHYYDIYRLLESEAGLSAASDLDLAADCVRHARMFFNSPDLNLATAAPGSFTLSPNRDMAADLSRDYTAMSGMIFGKAPSLGEILDRVADFEANVKRGGTDGIASFRRFTSVLINRVGAMKHDSRNCRARVREDPPASACGWVQRERRLRPSDWAGAGGTCCRARAVISEGAIYAASL